MGKSKWIMLWIILAIFISAIASYINSYNKIISDATIINHQMETSIDTAIEASLMSDEFFQGGKSVSSTISSTSYESDAEFSNIVYVRGADNEINGLEYILNGNKNVLANANRSTAQMQDYMKSLYGAGTDFVSYYNNFGRDLENLGYNMQQNVFYYNAITQNYEIETVPTLDLTGIPYEAGGAFNKATTVDAGEDLKLVKKGRGGNDYFLTPTAVGITYIQPELYEGILRSNIELLFAYNNMTEDEDINFVSAQKEQKHIGCICSANNINGDNLYDNESMYHDISGSDEENNIINASLYEVDLSSIDADIEYRAYDMFDNSNNGILNEVFGAIPLKDYTGNDYLIGGVKGNIQASAYKNVQGYVNRADIMRDSYNQETDHCYVVVAKVTTRIKLYIPYRSTILQQYSESKHNSVQQVNSSGSTWVLDTSDDGVWYEYTTFVAVTP